MVKSVISMDQLKALWHSEVHNEQKWAANMVKSLAFFSLYASVYVSFGSELSYEVDSLVILYSFD